jgi:hypothetical protein
MNGVWSCRHPSDAGSSGLRLRLALAEPALVIVSVYGVGGKPYSRPNVDEMANLSIHPSGMDIMGVETTVPVDPITCMEHAIRAGLRKPSEQVSEHVKTLIFASGMIVGNNSEEERVVLTANVLDNRAVDERWSWRFTVFLRQCRLAPFGLGATALTCGRMKRGLPLHTLSSLVD